jgi:hypothetical protein
VLEDEIDRKVRQRRIWENVEEEDFFTMYFLHVYRNIQMLSEQHQSPKLWTQKARLILS